MKLTLFYFSVITSLILFSCEKDDKLNVEKNPQVPLISKVLVNGKTVAEYTYNASNLISEEKNQFFYIKHNYDTKNLFASSDYYYDFSLDTKDRTEWVNSTNTTKSLSKLFEYVDNTKFKVIFSRPEGGNTEYSEYTFENDKVVKQTMYLDNKISGHIDYQYDANGNLTKEVKYVISTGTDVLMTSTEYTYDNKENPFRTFKRVMNPGINTNANNIIKETYTINYSVPQSIDKVQVTQNTYEYNDKGFPVKVNGNTEYKYLYR